MATGYRLSNGLDLDQVFAARLSTAGSNVGFRNSAGTDLAQVFEPLPGTSYGSATGYRNSAGTDFNSLFSTTAGAPQNFSTSGSAFNIIPSATCEVFVNRDGTVAATDGSTVNWFSPTNTTIGDLYQVKFEHTGGSGGSWGGSFSSWMALTSNRTVSLQEDGQNQSTSGQVQIAIRRASDLVQVCTGTVNVSAEVSNV